MNAELGERTGRGGGTGVVPPLNRRQGPDHYYDYPPLEPPGWRWQVPTYFFTGGVASGAYVAATLADLFGREEDRAVSRAGRIVAILFLLVSPILLIVDLGRPERFHHMLRVLKVRSPMNLGTWGLTGFGGFAAMGLVLQAVEDGLIGRETLIAKFFGWVPITVTGVLGSLFAFFVGSYTGVLLSFTNAPVWAKNPTLQGPLFLASALSTGLAATRLVLPFVGGTTRRSEAWLGRAENIANLVELGLAVGSLLNIRSQAGPLVVGRQATWYWPGAIGLGMVVPLLLRTREVKARGATRAALVVAGSLSTLVGGFIFRWTETRAGKQSVQEARYYFKFSEWQGGTGGGAVDR